MTIMLMKAFRSSPIKFSDQALYEENNLPKEVQLIRVGKFYHNGEEIEVNNTHLERMVVNFKEKVRGIDLMIDYGHNSEGEAAAWIDDLFIKEDGSELWARVVWTEGGKDAILSKKYRYLSADFMFNYVDNETLAEHGPTLFGAGLTNRPVVKNMTPVVQLSEKQGEYQMDELKKELEALKEKLAALEGMIGKAKMPEEEEALKEAEKAAYAEKKKELEEKEKELSEKQDKMTKEAAFNKLFSEGKVVEAQRESFLAGDVVKFSELAAELKTTNDGNVAKGKEAVEDAEAKIVELAEKYMKEEKITFSEGVRKALSENKDLAEKYNKKFQE